MLNEEYDEMMVLMGIVSIVIGDCCGCRCVEGKRCVGTGKEGERQRGQENLVLYPQWAQTGTVKL